MRKEPTHYLINDSFIIQVMYYNAIIATFEVQSNYVDYLLENSFF